VYENAEKIVDAFRGADSAEPARIVKHDDFVEPEMREISQRGEIVSDNR